MAPDARLPPWPPARPALLPQGSPPLPRPALLPPCIIAPQPPCPPCPALQTNRSASSSPAPPAPPAPPPPPSASRPAAPHTAAAPGRPTSGPRGPGSQPHPQAVHPTIHPCPQGRRRRRWRAGQGQWRAQRRRQRRRGRWEGRCRLCRRWRCSRPVRRPSQPGRRRRPHRLRRVAPLCSPSTGARAGGSRCWQGCVPCWAHPGGGGGAIVRCPSLQSELLSFIPMVIGLVAKQKWSLPSWQHTSAGQRQAQPHQSQAWELSRAGQSAVVHLIQWESHALPRGSTSHWLNRRTWVRLLQVPLALAPPVGHLLGSVAPGGVAARLLVTASKWG